MSKKQSPPRRLFPRQPRSEPEVINLELRGSVLSVWRNPLPSVAAWVQSHRGTFRPGVHEVVVEHDGGCTYPTVGDECTCIAGPSIKAMGIEAENN